MRQTDRVSSNSLVKAGQNAKGLVRAIRQLEALGGRFSSIKTRFAMDWVTKIFSPKPSASTTSSPSLPSRIKLEKKSESKAIGIASGSSKRRHVEFATNDSPSTILLPAEPSKKLQKISATLSFESSPSLKSKTQPSHTDNNLLEKAEASFSDPFKRNSSVPHAENSAISNQPSILPPSVSSLQHPSLSERVSSFLKMKGEANEALAPLEVKMVTELLGSNPSAATISALDRSIQAFQLNSSFSKVTSS